MTDNKYEVVLQVGWHSMDDDIPFTMFTSNTTFDSRQKAEDVASMFSSFLGVEHDVHVLEGDDD